MMTDSRILHDVMCDDRSHLARFFCPSHLDKIWFMCYARSSFLWECMSDGSSIFIVIPRVEAWIPHSFSAKWLFPAS